MGPGAGGIGRALNVSLFRWSAGGTHGPGRPCAPMPERQHEGKKGHHFPSSPSTCVLHGNWTCPRTTASTVIPSSCDSTGQNLTQSSRVPEFPRAYKTSAPRSPSQHRNPTWAGCLYFMRKRQRAESPLTVSVQKKTNPFKYLTRSGGGATLSSGFWSRKIAPQETGLSCGRGTQANSSASPGVIRESAHLRTPLSRIAARLRLSA